MHSDTPRQPFHGHAVVRAAFTIAVFGWGFGFYGPPVFLHAVMVRTGWPLQLVSAAVSLHFLAGAAVVTLLPRLHRRWGLAWVTAAGAALLALGVLGWALAREPWQLFAAALLSGGSWVGLGAAALNAMVSPWFARGRPMALAKAYNGASVGGMLMAPLWAALMAAWGFAMAALLLGALMWVVVWPLALGVLRHTPAGLGQAPDGEAAQQAGGAAQTSAHAPAPLTSSLWRHRGFLTLAFGMALGLFAQIGLVAQLYTLMVPVLGAQPAGWVMALATGCGMLGRLGVARLLRPQLDRRLMLCASYAVQMVGIVLLLLVGVGRPALLVLGVVLFGLGIGNATSLPPLIAQMEFAKDDVPRVVARSVALGQALYAFAPAVFAWVLAASGGTVAYFAALLAVQLAAMACMLAGRR
jgi:hypothetical protein